MKMRIRRGPLFWGLLLIPLGAIPLLARAGMVPDDLIGQAWRWWPVLLIGLGIAVLLGRSRASLVGTVILALTLGTLGGSALAGASLGVGSVTGCVGTGGDLTSTEHAGSFTGDATTTIALDCGSVELTVQPGTDWVLDAAYHGEPPRVEASATGLTIRAPDTFGSDRQEWAVALGADALRRLDLTINAGSSSAKLASAALTDVNIQMNAGDLMFDGAGAQVDQIQVQVNAGRLRMTVDGPSIGSLQANAGVIELCVPPDADVTLQVEEQLTFVTNLGGSGLTQQGETWTRPGPGAPIRFDVQGNAASFTLDPEGGCR